MYKKANFRKKSQLVRIAIASIFVLATALFWTFKYRTALAEPLLEIGKGTPYSQEWLRVDSLVSKGLYKSALDLSNQIYIRAKSEDNNGQIVKALMHRFKFSQIFQENSSDNAIYDLQKELKSSKFPLTPVLHAMLADLYWEYYQTNRYQFHQRSQTVGFKNDSINTWDVNHLIDQTVKHYRLSLDKSDELKKISSDIYAPVINKGSAPSELRPTLYDFLAWKAFDFFKDEEPSITRPADKFVLDNANQFSSASSFVGLNIPSKDTMSLKFYALNIIKDIVAFHLDDKNTDALVDAELQRLIFVRANSVLPEKDSLYEFALTKLSTNYPENKYTGEVLYYLANYHFELGDAYVAGKEDKNRLRKKRALEICDDVIKRFPDTQGQNSCSSLRLTILLKSLSFTNEETAIPNQPTIALLTYKNVTNLYFRIAKLSEEIELQDDERSEEEIIKGYLKLNPIKVWEETLPEDGDYQSHKAELKIPAMPPGKYIILVSAEKDFPMKTNGIAYGIMWSSSISYLSRPQADGSYDYYLFDRLTGEPMAGVSAQTWIYKYEYYDRNDHYRRGEKFISDKVGHIFLPAVKDYRNFILELTSSKSHLFTASTYQYKPNKSRSYSAPKTFFFTDRSIYRPGQAVFFKGIVINTNGENNEIIKGHPTAVTFYDVNSQKVKTLQLTTNEFGSFSGSFIAPSTGLTGQMRIQNECGSKYLSVEEYKRPKFEVNMEPVTGAYRTNEKIEVKGTAKTFAGAVVNGAEVKYRVVRSARFPWWWYCWRGYYPTSNSVEITNGVVTSNDTGGFVVPFIALPDRSVTPASKPIFSYDVYIDVVDITGETHSASTSVHVGYTALELTVSAPAYIDKSDTNSIDISLKNLSGSPETNDVSFSIKKLIAPTAFCHDRQWAMPDKFIYKKTDWKSWFPEEQYSNENDMTTWTKGESVYSGIVNTGKNKKLKLKKDYWTPGNYILEASTKDKYGEEVKDVRYFTVFDIKEKTPATQEAWSFQPIITSCQPGEKAVYLIGTSGKDVTVIYEIEKQNKIVETKWLKLSKEQKYIEIPVTEADRGNFSVHFAFVYHNRAYTRDQTVFVPWKSKELDISIETFRNKLLPGQKEEWKLKIKGPDGEKVMAEMCAAMYDASLDQFRGHSWDFYLWKSYYGSMSWQHGVEGTSSSNLWNNGWNDYVGYNNKIRTYDELNWFGYYYGYRNYYWGYFDSTQSDFSNNLSKAGIPVETLSEIQPSSESKNNFPKTRSLREPNFKSALGRTDSSEQEKDKGEDGNIEKQDLRGSGNKEVNLSDVKARTNLNETVFFFPQLETDSTGTVIIKFTMNEALTRWKFMAFAHTKDLKYAQIQREVVTQKELMITPNAPRFLREGDHITFTSKVSNLTGKELTGSAQLMLFDAISMKPIDAIMLLTPAQVSFTIKKGQSAPINWDLIVPEGISAVNYKVVAASENFSDGEENVLPILSNRMLVTETMPLPIRAGQTKEFRFEKLMNQSNGSSTIRNQKLTLEFTANPAWYAVQALPYMMEYPYECSEQTFSRFYANGIATNIANSTPKIRAVFESWKTQSPDAFLSNLEKNQDLKNVVLKETPWVLEGKDESDRKRRVGLLFDINHMATEQERMLRKLEQMQVSNGGWPWFNGDRDDRYITQRILTGMGHLDHLGVKLVREDPRCWNMVTKGIQYLDQRIREDYEWILKWNKDKLNENHLSYISIQYLYARSFFKEVTMSVRNKEAFDYFYTQEQKYWTNQSRYMQGMIALAQFRYDAEKSNTANDVMKSLKETALNSEEMGMYWKENTGGYYWYQAPIETQALLIEAFKDVKNDTKSVDGMRVWLLKNKQTNDWKTTTATAEACYALLLDGTSWLATESDVSIVVGTQKIDLKELGIKEEAGTGYFKTSWSGQEIKPEMGKVSVTKTGPGVSWGAMYWQYFENIDKITPAQTPLSVQKQLFLVQNTASGPVISPINDKTVLHPGDKIRVRIELRSDRPMEYIHMKDMRASGFEPVNVLSQYKYQDGLGYYESTKDASTDFFFNFLPKGVHVFEYTLTVIHAGDFSNGITQVQCMYAPEFSCHSAGTRVFVTATGK